MVLRALSLVVIVGCSSVHETSDLAYDERFGERTSLDIYSPVSSRVAPAVMLIHGGSWRTGFKEQFEDVAQRLAGAGYAAITINHRLGPAGAFPNAAQDCVCALSYVREHSSQLAIDSARIAVMGYSSGAQLAALVGVAAEHPDLAPDCAAGATGVPAAVISAAGMQDLHDFADYETVRDFLGGDPSHVPDAYQLASPMLRVGASEPPFLLIHGTADVFVDADQSVRMQTALRDQGNEARLLLLRGGGHLFNPSGDGTELVIDIASDAPEAWLAIIDFLDHTIGPP